MAQLSLFSKQKQTSADLENKPVVTKGERGWELGLQIQVTVEQQGPAIENREPNTMSYNKPRVEKNTKRICKYVQLNHFAAHRG